MKENIVKLKHKECYVVPEGDYGKAEIWLINDLYVVFSIPMFGGSPVFEDVFLTHQIDHMIHIINSWT